MADNLESAYKEDVIIKLNSLIKWLEETLPQYPKIGLLCLAFSANVMCVVNFNILSAILREGYIGKVS